MNTSFVRAAFAASSIALVATTGAHASTASAIAKYDVTSAESSIYNGSGGHSVWLPTGVLGGGNKAHFDFSPAGSFKVFDDDTATLTGNVISETKGSGYGFVVDAKFEKTMVGSGGPKKQLSSGAYTENGGPIDTSTWSYFKMVSGTLTGTGSLSHLVFNLFEAPADGSAPFQLGDGASGKNLNFGGSGWFFYGTTASGCDATGSGCYQGDFNLDLTAVPLPAAGLLLPVALGGLAFPGRRRRKAA
ncbi:MAG: VPLPA-CTERM sorting domain-containing protein [Litoreibacter sp.]|nr:VPLPA-CTERM sorting domain-containing protein [Litoreibacter sp.]